ncbi:hypothetical protein HMPREF1545_00611 [Oscillibacter sp. KLE 1728]|nr:hypothetical protein HMPREF1545_00611 [Oscillibacter sp. KLE 1728]
MRSKCYPFHRGIPPKGGPGTSPLWRHLVSRRRQYPLPKSEKEKS